MGVTQAAGLSLKWFREQFAGDLSYREMDQQAAGVLPGAEGILYLPYLMGERTPHLDPTARGVFFGLSARHERRHLIRAVMEGVAFSLRDCLEVLKEMKIPVQNMLAVGGGAKSRFWCEILAGVYEMPILLPKASYGAALGAAILAGTAVGVYNSVENACDRLIRETSAVEPKANYEKMYEIYIDLYRCLKDDYIKLKKLEAEKHD